MLYQFKYTLSEKDYMEFNKYHLLNAPSNKRGIIVLRLLLPLIFLVYLLFSFFLFEEHSSLLIEFIIFAVISVIWFFIVKPLLIFNLKLRIKMIKKDGKLPYGKDVLVQFDEDSFIETIHEAESKANYKIIEKIAVGKNAAYIYINAMQAVIVPFSVFETNEQKNEFLAFINKKRETAREIK